MQLYLYSAPKEEYKKHIELCKKKFVLIFPLFKFRLRRILSYQDEKELDEKELYESFAKMITFHDLGKLTYRWQENLNNNKRLPTHASLGAAYLYKVLPEGLREPISFAVAIHHTDSGLLGDNIERPDVQAILDGIVDFNGNIVWAENVYTLGDLFPEDARSLNIMDLKEMARGLRIWARGSNFLERHKRRLQVSVAHHILKLCDISAATERKDYQRENEQDYYGGWLMVEEIKRYVDNKKLFY